MKRFRLESEIVKIQESKLRISDPYCNTDQGDYMMCEGKSVKLLSERNLLVQQVRPERK